MFKEGDITHKSIGIQVRLCLVGTQGVFNCVSVYDWLSFRNKKLYQVGLQKYVYCKLLSIN